MNNSEYKPGFKAWLFSIFLAAGFGNLAADGLGTIIADALKKQPELKLRDKECNPRKDGRYKCDYYLENIGDYKTFITKVIVGSSSHDHFFTSNALVSVGPKEDKIDIEKAHIALVNANDVVMIGLIMSSVDDVPGNVCFINLEEKLLCV